MLRSSLVGALGLGLLLASCGGHAQSAQIPPAQITKAFAGSPPPLAALHAQAGQLVGGGPAAFKALLVSLKGHPVVVNKWASWCGPCQFEFPAFQRAAVSYGNRVAFVGLDSNDFNEKAASFLRKFPVTYPSYVDPHEDIARSLEAFGYFPATIYFDRAGKRAYTKGGPYRDTAALERDVRRYALR